MEVLGYITDLFLQAKISQITNQAGAKLKVVSSIYKFLPELKNNPILVVVDLNAEGICPAPLISQVKSGSDSVSVIAFADREQGDLMDRAREAGADQVLPRSDFEDELGAILDKLAAAGKK